MQTLNFEPTTRTAIVTGASRGIGRGIAVSLGEAGWRVAVNYAGSAEAAAETVEFVRQAGGEARAVQADVSRDADRRRLVSETVETFGPIGLLVNNAGITSPGRHDVLDATEEGFDRVMGVNLKGPFFLSQLVARHMIENASKPDRESASGRGGVCGGGDGGGGRSIINISSLSAYTVSTNRGDYCMAKAAMGMMTQLWAARLAEHGINVYELRPGVIASDMTAPVREKYDRLIHQEGVMPIARWGQPADVGRAAAALAGGAFAYSTGDTINIDGGFHIRRL